MTLAPDAPATSPALPTQTTAPEQVEPTDAADQPWVLEVPDDTARILREMHAKAQATRLGGSATPEADRFAAYLKALSDGGWPKQTLANALVQPDTGKPISREAVRQKIDRVEKRGVTHDIGQLPPVPPVPKRPLRTQTRTRLRTARIAGSPETQIAVLAEILDAAPGRDPAVQWRKLTTGSKRALKERLRRAAEIADQAAEDAEGPAKAADDAALSLAFYDEQQGVGTKRGVGRRTFLDMRRRALGLPVISTPGAATGGTHSVGEFDGMTPEEVKALARQRKVRYIATARAEAQLAENAAKEKALRLRAMVALEARDELLRVLRPMVDSAVELAEIIGRNPSRVAHILSYR